MLSSGMTLGKQLAKIIGFFSSVIPAVLPTPLHYCALQSLKHQAIQECSYGLTVILSDGARQVLHWWVNHLEMINDQPIHYYLRCLHFRMGGSLCRSRHWRGMVQPEMFSSLQLPRATCSSFCHQVLCQGHQKCTNLSVNGQ